MRGKKETRRAGSRKYLLSVDRTSRPSLRKLEEDVKPAKKRASVKPASKAETATRRRAQSMDEATEKTTPPRQAPLNTKVVLGGAVCAVAAVALLMIGRPSKSPEELVAELHGVSVDQVERVEPFAVETTVEEPAAVSIPVSSTPRAASTIAVSAPAPKETASEAKHVVAPPSPVLSDKSTSAASPSSAAAAQAPVEEAVTVAGCLARDDDAFMLKDATGDAAPAGRSWKSGFLKKRSSSIALIDEGSLRLASHVGQRVEMRGVLANKQLRAKSLRVMGECD